MAKRKATIRCKMPIESHYRELLASVREVRSSSRDAKNSGLPSRIHILPRDLEKLGRHLVQAGVDVRHSVYFLNRLLFDTGKFKARPELAARQ